MSYFNQLNDALDGRLTQYYCGILLKKKSSQVGTVYLPLTGEYYDLTGKQVIDLRDDVNACSVDVKTSLLSGIFLLTDIFTSQDLFTRLGTPLSKVDTPNL